MTEGCSLEKLKVCWQIPGNVTVFTDGSPTIGRYDGRYLGRVHKAKVLYLVIFAFLNPILMRHLLTLFCLLFLVNLSAQRLDHRQGELIIEFTEGAAAGAKEWMESRVEITDWSPIGRSLPIYLVRFDHATYSADQLRRMFWQDQALVNAQLNYLITQRGRPNDQRYDDQWHHLNVGQLNGTVGADHNVEPAWDVTTGGVTANGDTIVVAVLDDGTDLDHEDIVGNLWRNTDEIPGNGMDDDNNGYVDDVFGFDTAGNDSDPGASAADNHGTPVAGIVGARGNNGLGVSGMNWNVKIMSIRNGFLTAESEVLAAYLYALEARLEYDASNGQRGAYVVATNASWGRDFGKVEDSPIWCDLYDQLGEAGILNAGATINGNVNVDEDGDLPTNCPSEYLIGVTNLNNQNVKVTGAGFGNVSIDLGAFGEDVFTTDNGNGYGYFGGTSAATPQVAGAIALLYAAPCAAFGELLEADPAAAARLVRKTILENTTANTSLQGISVSGGRLDVGKAMTDLMNRCDECFAPTSFSAEPVEGSATSIRVSWRAIASLGGSVDLRYRPAGTNDWTTMNSLTGILTTVPGLSACVAYEFQLTASCGSTPVSTEILTVSTDGCCVIPEDFRVAAAPNELFRIDWTPLLAAQSYRVRYRRVGDEEWTNRSAGGSSGILGVGGVDPCTDYEFEFQTNCDTLITDFGSRLTVRSFGCGACLEEEYCIPDQFDNEQEHIARVAFGGVFSRDSGPEPGGYRNVGEIGSGSFVRGGVYRLTLTPDAGGELDEEGWKVYVDWNQDGALASTEVAAELDNPEGEPAVVDILIPEDAVLGLTRMRVMMQFGGVRGNACGSSALGEVEDYCLDIIDAEGCPPPASVRATFIEAIDETILEWPASAAPGGSYRLRYRPRGSNEAWVEMDVDQPTATIRPLNLCATYELEIASLCDGNPGEYRLFLFMDDCTDTDAGRIDSDAWSIFPNPAYQNTRVRYTSALRPANIRLIDGLGRPLREVAPGSSFTDLDVGDLPAGLYLVELRLADGLTGVRKLLVR